MTRTLRRYHMGCGENLSSSCWEALLLKPLPAAQNNAGKKLLHKTHGNKKSH
ncbi:MAG: hypothetical protein R6X06_11355 [Gammaproteobacteria bacterium]